MAQFVAFTRNSFTDLSYIQISHIVSVSKYPENQNKTVIRTVDGVKWVVSEELAEVRKKLLRGQSSNKTS